MSVIAFDRAGNEARVKVDVIYDIVPPTIDLEDTPAGTQIPFAWINGTVDEDGIKVVYFNGVMYPIIDRVFELQWSIDTGYNNIVVEVWDRAGNAASEDIVVFYSTDHPFLEVNEALDLGDNRYLISGSCSDYIQNITIDGIEYPVIDSDFWEEIEVTSGTDRILVSVEDPAGNTAQEWVELGLPAVVWYLAVVVTIVVIVCLVFTIVAKRASKDAGRQP